LFSVIVTSVGSSITSACLSAPPIGGAQIRMSMSVLVSRGWRASCGAIYRRCAVTPLFESRAVMSKPCLTVHAR
jgi:hypothetical protein